MDTPTSMCSACGKSFQVRFRYQVQEGAQGFQYYCSQMCHQQALERAQGCACSVCGKGFVLEYPYQAMTKDSGPTYFCSAECRAQAEQAPAPVREPKRIAVFNHKGGTGKTTTAVNLAAGLAELGAKVLLIDADGQGNVGASLGIRGDLSLYHVIVLGVSAEQAAVPVRDNLHVLTSNETLAAAELYLAGLPNRDRVLRERLGDRTQGYDVVVVDCAPALSLMNQNVLVYADSVIIPVSCDYLSIVGVRQVLRTMKNVRELLDHPLEILGVVPTFYDARTKISREAVDAMREHFGDKCIAPIRVNTKLAEAPRMRQTIFEYAPDSHGAEDYLALVRSFWSMRTARRGGLCDEAERRAGAGIPATVAAGGEMERAIEVQP